MRLTTTIVMAACTLCVAAASGQLLIPDDRAGTIALHDAADGALIDGAFISSPDFVTPREALQVGDEIWVSDNAADAVFIFDLSGNEVGRVTDGIDRARGLAVLGETVFLAAGGQDGGGRVLTLDAVTRQVTGSFAEAGVNPADVLAFGKGLLVSDRDVVGGQGVHLVDPDGTFGGLFIIGDDADGPDNPAQVSRSGGRLAVAASDVPNGVYLYDDAGDLDAVRPTLGGARGAWVLGSGDVLYTTAIGTFRVNDAGVPALVGTGNRYISEVTIPEPAAVAVVGVTSLALLRRRG